ncbi:zinc-binding protein A33-like isoform X2 [Parambassis ranga]|uniref:Zinc-binding protein A33-like isoform X2 n=1 Tax=Parambassis ranga TaxID=210632 RepID=A0A6P7HCG9_9TELE|nr:zinc-binding protein A33-like isoform X2 [Parambassis ranga]
MAANVSQSEADFNCPVCCDLFKDPVVLLCGHSFCKFCLQEWWRQSRLQSCPVCKEIFPMPQPPRNLALRNLSDALRRERSHQTASGSEELCSVHGEKLKLFCLDDRQLICLICRDAKQHKKHNCVPVNEAAEDHRKQLKINLMYLRSKLGVFKQEKLTCDQMASHIKTQQTEKSIREEFQELYQFLRAEEASRMDALKNEAIFKSQAVNQRIVKINAVISSLTDTIKTIEEELKAQDISFMQRMKTTLERSQSKLPEPETPSNTLIDEAKHLGNLQYSVWRKMKNIIQYTPVTLDPNTGSRALTVSQHLTCVTLSDKHHSFPNNPERKSQTDILGYEGFSSGKHSWDVEVGKVDPYWAVGVASRTNVWAIYLCPCTNVMREEPSDGICKFYKDVIPQKVRVHLDYTQGLLSFIDLDRQTPVHTIQRSFTETVFPYFRRHARILPAEVKIRVQK